VHRESEHHALMCRNEFRTGHIIAGATALDEGGFAAIDV